MGALIVLSMWPPAVGKMLLVPIAGQDANDVARIAVSAGASLIGIGPFPGSLVVAGKRSAVSDRNLPWTVVIMAAPPAGCGG